MVAALVLYSLGAVLAYLHERAPMRPRGAVRWSWVALWPFAAVAVLLVLWIEDSSHT